MASGLSRARSASASCVNPAARRTWRHDSTPSTALSRPRRPLLQVILRVPLQVFRGRGHASQSAAVFVCCDLAMGLR
jgi:hypothetical protein